MEFQRKESELDEKTNARSFMTTSQFQEFMLGLYWTNKGSSYLTMVQNLEHSWLKSQKHHWRWEKKGKAFKSEELLWNSIWRKENDTENSIIKIKIK